MNRIEPPLETISEQFISSIVARLATDGRFRRELPGGGRIHFDRRMPFLCVYRQPDPGLDPGTEQLITAETAFLVVPSDPRLHKPVAALVQTIAGTLAARFGSFLILELWSASDDKRVHAVYADSGEPVPPAPGFWISGRGAHWPSRTMDTLARSLQKIRLFRQPARVELDDQGTGHPPGLRPLIPPGEARRMECYMVGLEVQPVYRDPDTGQLFPAVLRHLRRRLGRALKQSFFTFVCTHTNIRPQHYYTLGLRTLGKTALEVDRQLAEISDSFDLLLQATPVNAEAAWWEFRRQRFEVPPVFHYRPLTVEPALLKRRLYAIPIERIEDPTLAHLFRQKQDELDRQITLLGDVGTSRFLPESLQIYGRVEASLLKLAQDLLERIPSRSREDSTGGPLDAQAFARQARKEIGYYRRRYPQFEAQAVVRDDLYSGLMVSGGELLIGRGAGIPGGRVEALLQHEIGTHLVTYYNGRAQPLRQLDSGLAGYDGLQEGLAVLAEYLVGGLSRPRLRLLAARVLAAQQLTDGASFVDTFRLLDRHNDFSKRVAYVVTMRVYRGGGLTKDVVYLRGLVQILDYLGSGGELEPLLVGKMAADHIPLIQELLHRQILKPPAVRPRYLERPQVRRKLQRLRQGLSVLELVEGKKK